MRISLKSINSGTDLPQASSSKPAGGAFAELLTNSTPHGQAVTTNQDADDSQEHGASKDQSNTGTANNQSDQRSQTSVIDRESAASTNASITTTSSLTRTQIPANTFAEPATGSALQNQTPVVSKSQPITPVRLSKKSNDGQNASKDTSRNVDSRALGLASGATNAADANVPSYSASAGAANPVSFATVSDDGAIDHVLQAPLVNRISGTGVDQAKDAKSQGTSAETDNRLSEVVREQTIVGQALESSVTGFDAIHSAAEDGSFASDQQSWVPQGGGSNRPLISATNKQIQASLSANSPFAIPSLGVAKATELQPANRLNVALQAPANGISSAAAGKSAEQSDSNANSGGVVSRADTSAGVSVTQVMQNGASLASNTGHIVASLPMAISGDSHHSTVAPARNSATDVTVTGRLDSGESTSDESTSMSGLQGLSGISSAQLIQKITDSEMRVGLHSSEFGAISIRTSVTQQTLQAQIAVDHDGLGSALSAHIPAMQARFGSDFGLQASIDVNSGGSQFSGGQQQQPQQQQPGTFSPGLLEMAGASSDLAVQQVQDVTTYDSRLDVRA